MRVAIFSDVHGNLSGLEAVLDDIEKHRPDLVVFAGDLCLIGPRPAESLRLVRERRLPSVVGNTDGWIVGAGSPPARAAPVIEWTRQHLSPQDLEWLGSLPFSLQISPTAEPNNRLLIVHANPFNVDDLLYPPVEEQLARYGEVRQSDVELAARLDGVEAAVLAFGHLHIPSIRTIGQMTLINASSVSMPGDGDGRAKYALLEWRGGQWSAAIHRVALDAKAEREAFMAHRPPRWEQAVVEIDADGTYFPQQI